MRIFQVVGLPKFSTTESDKFFFMYITSTVDDLTAGTKKIVVLVIDETTPSYQNDFNKWIQINLHSIRQPHNLSSPPRACRFCNVTFHLNDEFLCGKNS